MGRKLPHGLPQIRDGHAPRTGSEFAALSRSQAERPAADRLSVLGEAQGQNGGHRANIRGGRDHVVVPLPVRAVPVIGNIEAESEAVYIEVVDISQSQIGEVRDESAIDPQGRGFGL